MTEEWWPPSLAHISTEDPWALDHVVVAEIKSFEFGSRAGLRLTISALVPLSDLEAIRQNPSALSHVVSASGPRPFPRDEPFEPRFWIEAYERLNARYEPLVLSWTSHNHIVLVPDPGFLMTYGLTPRNAGEGIVCWNDPTTPLRDVVKVISPSVYSFPSYTPASVSILKSYLQDYLSLRKRALVQSFMEQRHSPVSAELEERLSGREIVDLDTSARQMRLFRLPGERIIVAEASSARVVAQPGPLPITEDDEQAEGLIWPGIEGPVDHQRAMAMGTIDFVYVDDKVLGDYEGRSEFRIYPESGGVSFGTQWAVSHCTRVKRNLIRLELKKLYEGVPPTVTRNWHKFAVNPPREETYDALTAEPNVAKRAKALIYAFARLAKHLSGFAHANGLGELGPTNFVDIPGRSDLDYHGWWTFPEGETAARHIPLAMTADAFLDRCLVLNKLLAEDLIESSLRSALRSAGVPENKIEKLGSLKLLDRIVCLCQVANKTGLRFRPGSDEIWARFSADGTTPKQPLARLFALYDMRILKAHKAGDRDKLISCLSRFGIDAGQTASGYGVVLDRIYDALIDEIDAANAKIQAAEHNSRA